LADKTLGIRYLLVYNFFHQSTIILSVGKTLFVLKVKILTHDTFLTTSRNYCNIYLINIADSHIFQFGSYIIEFPIMVSASTCPLCKNFLSVFLVVFSIWIQDSFASLPETFETCGIFLQDFQSNTSFDQGDLIYQIIDQLQQNHKMPQSLIIATKLFQKEIYPNIFRSMKYDCYLYAHINFGPDMFSTIPSFENQLQSALYKKATVLIFINSWPYDMLTTKSRLSHFDSQYRMFVVQIQMTLHNLHNQSRSKLLIFNEIYFFCCFCELLLIPLNVTSPNNYLSLKLTSFEKIWMPLFTHHYYQVLGKYDLETQELCRQKSMIDFYRKNMQKCSTHNTLTGMIILASGVNFTIKLYISQYYDYSKKPQFFDNLGYSKFLSNYLSPVLNIYKYPSIIYCLNLGSVAIAETNMWTKFVSMNVWGLVGLTIVVLAMLNALSGSCKKLTKCILIVRFLNSFLKLLRILCRQSLSHKWRLLGVIELLFSAFLISMYENSITVSIVVPLVPKPFPNPRELYNNNYTFVVQEYSLNVYNWIYAKFDSVSGSTPRVLSEPNFWRIDTWLEKYFLGNESGTKKYAIVGDLSTHYHFPAVTFLKEKNDTCYQMFPTEEGFYPQDFYFAFASSAAPVLNRGVFLLQAFGFLRVLEIAKNFRTSLIALDDLRSLASKHGYYEGISYKELKIDRLQENLITLGNIKSVLYVGLIIILSAVVTFVAEICSTKMTALMMLTKRRRFLLLI